MDTSIKTSRFIAGDDLRIGQYVAVVSETFEFVPWSFTEAWNDTVQVQRVELMPDDTGRPLKVKDVCLPFVLVRTPDGNHSTLDVRRHKFVQLDKAFGRHAFDRLAGSKKKRRIRNK